MGIDPKTLIAVALFLLGPLVSLLIFLMPATWKRRLLWLPRSVVKRASAWRAARAARKPKPAPKPAPKPKPVPRPKPAANRLQLPQQRPMRSARRRRRPPSALADVPRKQLEERLIAVFEKAATVAHDARTTAITNRFSHSIDIDVARKARTALLDLRGLTEEPKQELVDRVNRLELVLANLEEIIEQRRDPAVSQRLSDADEIASACYQPILDFASSKRLGLAPAQPVTKLGGFDEDVSAGFMPTRLALLYLPAQFFDNAARWPAIAHEIGHHFVAASDEVNEQLRAQLGLSPERVGLQRLSLNRAGDQIQFDDLPRILGGWFEELFADVFASLMLGPAYVATMTQLFAAPHDPKSTTRVVSDAARPVYDQHPPRHLRFVAAARVIELSGMTKEAARLRAEWSRLHGGEPGAFQLPTAVRSLDLPAAPLLALTVELVDRLCKESLRAVSGRRLAEVPGLAFGLRENAAAERVRSDLRNGRIPLTANAREIVAGVVFAVRDEPKREAQLIALARRGLRGIRGILDDGADAQRDVDAASVEELREAFLLHTILSPPPGRRRLGLPSREFLSRPGTH